VIGIGFVSVAAVVAVVVLFDRTVIAF